MPRPITLGLAVTLNRRDGLMLEVCVTGFEQFL
jgi:hypothetical protein